MTPFRESWAEILKDDINALPRAIKQAEQAADYLEMHAGIMPVSEYEKKYSKENSRTLTINENNIVQEEQSAELMLTPTIA